MVTPPSQRPADPSATAPSGAALGHEATLAATSSDASTRHAGAAAGAATLTTIGGFTIAGELGRGGMGVVYRALDTALHRDVAIKVLHDTDEWDGEATRARASDRLLREAQAMARLSHPNVVQIYEVGETEGRVHVVMEYIAGTTLAGWQRATPPRPWHEVLAHYLDAGRGLAAAHRAGLVHRDFKPSNVLLGDDGRVCVGDFGLARPLQAPARQDPTDAAASAPGAMVGTPAYMPPEQVFGAPADARSDQFSFCVALYEAVYGQRPHEGEHLGARYLAIQSGAVRPAPPATDVPTWLRDALLRGLAFDPAARWPAMEPLLAELDRDREAPRRRRVLLAGALSGALALALGGLWTAAARVEPVAPRPTDPAADPTLPRGEPLRPLPEAPPAAASPLEVDLGRALFHSPALAAAGALACVDCHLFDRGGADPRRHSLGALGRPSAVNAPSIFNLAFVECYHWDGRECRLDRQVLTPLLGPSLGSRPGEAAERLRGDVEVTRRAAALGLTDLTDPLIARALAAYLTTLTTPESPLDRHLRGDPHALTDEQRRGYALFKEIGCASCHQGAAVGGNLFERLGVVGDYFNDRPLTDADLGRYNVTHRDEDRHVFRVAPLRNVALTAPYFHDGAADTLAEAVQIMARVQLGKRLANDEVAALVAFLHALSGAPPEAP